MLFPLIAVTVDKDVAILGVQKPVIWQAWCLLFISPGAFVSMGTPWGTMGAAGRTRGVQNQIFYDFGVMSGPMFASFLGYNGLNCLNCMYLFGLASR